MPRASYYAEAFSPLPGRCFRLVAHPGEAGPSHCPEPVAWRGSWAPNGRRCRIEACEGHRPPPDQGSGPTAETSGRSTAGRTPFQAMMGAGQAGAATTEPCRTTPPAVQPGRYLAVGAPSCPDA